MTTTDTGTHHRTRRDIEDATDDIVKHWDDTLDPPRDVTTTTRPAPGSRPPVNTEALNTREEARRTLRSWAQLVAEDRQLTLGPRDNTVPSLAIFLGRHADWLSRHDAGPEAADELKHHAHRLMDLAKGHYTRKYQIGACPEITIDDQGIEIGRCGGSLWALMRQTDQLLPRAITCDLNRDHQWDPHTWPALGRRIGLLNQGDINHMLKEAAGL